MLGKQPYLVVHEAFIDRRSEIRSNDRIAIALYDWSGRVLRYQWPKMGKRLVHDHLRELSNAMNKWGSHILDLQAVTQQRVRHAWALSCSAAYPIMMCCLRTVPLLADAPEFPQSLLISSSPGPDT